jgi:hypothetical protein
MANFIEDDTSRTEYQRLIEKGSKRDTFAQRIAKVTIKELGCNQAKHHINDMLSFCERQTGLRAIDYAAALHLIDSHCSKNASG